MTPDDDDRPPGLTDSEWDAVARHTDPASSWRAAASIETKGIEAEIIEVLRINKGPPMCTVAIHAKLSHHPIDSISPRMSRMVTKGLIMCCGEEPRANRYGKLRKQLVYDIIRKGLPCVVQ